MWWFFLFEIFLCLLLIFHSFSISQFCFCKLLLIKTLMYRYMTWNWSFLHCNFLWFWIYSWGILHLWMLIFDSTLINFERWLVFHVEMRIVYQNSIFIHLELNIFINFINLSSFFKHHMIFILIITI